VGVACGGGVVCAVGVGVDAAMASTLDLGVLLLASGGSLWL
jgi:hypothetical protein